MLNSCVAVKFAKFVMQFSDFLYNSILFQWIFILCYGLWE